MGVAPEEKKYLEEMVQHALLKFMELSHKMPINVVKASLIQK
jgi:hypothetical protein